MSEANKKLVLMVTHGPDDQEMATIPFVMANAALAMDVDVLMGFQGKGAFLTMKGMADHVVAAGFPPLKDLLAAYQEAGGRMYVCGPCAGSRAIDKSELVDGASIVGAATFVSECLGATQVLVY
jgi:predicted peroxiredoxin